MINLPRAIPILLVVVVVVGACASLPDRQPAQTTDEETLSLAVTISEEMESGRSWTLPTGRHRQPIDYMSTLRIELDKEILRKIASTEEDVLPPLSGEDALRLERLPRLIELVQGVIAASDAVLDDVERLLTSEAAGLDLTTTAVREVQQTIHDEAKTRGEIITFLRQWAEAQAALSHHKDSEEFAFEVDRLTRAFFLDDRGRDVLLNIEVVGAFLCEQLEITLERTRQDVSAADLQGSVYLRLRAWLKARGAESALPLHVTNYDNIENPAAFKPPRIQYRMSEPDRQRLRQGFELARASAGFITEVRNKGDELSGSFSRVESILREQIDILWSETWKLVIGQAESIKLIRALQIVEDAESSPEKKAAITGLVTLITKINAFGSGLQALKSAVDERPSTDLLFYLEMIQDRVQDVQEVLLLSLEIDMNSLRVDIGLLRPIFEAHRDTFDENSQRLIDEVVANLLPKIEDQLLAFLNTLGPFEPLIKALATIGGFRAPTLATALKDVDPRVKTVPLDRVKRGTLAVHETPADSGDEIELRVELVDGEGQRLDEERWFFPVGRFGVGDQITSHLIFVDRVGTGGQQDPDIEFDPAPSVSWTLHYRIRVEPEGDFGSRLWTFFDPGIGFSLAALDFEDQNFQLGLGVHATLFNDLLQVGYGYNLNADRDRDYFFLGIDILQSLDNMGGIVGGGAK